MPPPATARPAATVLLLRDGATGPEVFMVVRHHAIAFAAGALVFPGGRVEEADHALAGALGPPADGARIAAIRETFEECGVLLARRRDSAEPVDSETAGRLGERHRAALEAGATGFDTVLAEGDLLPACDLLVPFAHWITPESQPKRYDTRFFLAEAPNDQIAAHDGREAVESIWVTPRDALAAAAAGRYKLVFATAMNLEKLARSATVAEALRSARGSLIVTVMPQARKLDNGRRLMRIPAEADYGGTEFTVNFDPAFRQA